MDSKQEILLIKEKYRAGLVKQYAGAYDDLNTNLDQSQRPVIEERIRQVAAKIKEVEEEIRALKLASADESQVLQSQVYRESFNSWEDNLHRIDFSKVNKSLRSIYDRLDGKSGSALFLLQNSNAMGGKWGIKAIRDRLQDLGKDWYPPLEYAFPLHRSIHQADFLSEVAQKFNYQMSGDTEQKIITDLIEKIYGALYGGQVFLIQIEIPQLDAKSTFLDWFVNQFWCPLVRRLPTVSQTSPLVKIFAVVTVRGSVNKTCLSDELICPNRQFDGEKILNLPLQKWTEADICNWLVSFSGLMSPAIGMTKPEVENMARSIYQVSEGRPSDVYHELRAYLGFRGVHLYGR